MLTKKRIPLLIALICGLEALIYLYAILRTEPEFVFDKCARFSGRASSEIFLLILLMVGYYGLKRIYGSEQKREMFQVLITVFTFNHLIHFVYLLLNFKRHVKPLHFAGNEHGIITFVFILIFPFIIWGFKNLNRVLYIAIILHLLNVSYFINKTFLSKVKPGVPAYHNQLGIVVITAACLYILYRVIRENKSNSLSNLQNK